MCIRILFSAEVASGGTLVEPQPETRENGDQVIEQVVLHGLVFGPYGGCGETVYLDGQALGRRLQQPHHLHQIGGYV